MAGFRPIKTRGSVHNDQAELHPYRTRVRRDERVGIVGEAAAGLRRPVSDSFSRVRRFEETGRTEVVHEEDWPFGNLEGRACNCLEAFFILRFQELEKQVDAGRIRSLGVSNFNETQLERLLKSNCKHKLTNNQVELHVYLQQRQLVEYCQKNGVTVTAFGPLGSPGYNDHLKRIGKQ